MDEVQLGAEGVAITVPFVDETGTVIDISTATLLQIKTKKPDGVTLSTDTAVFITDGTDGLAQYVTVTDYLDVIGLWEAQGYVELPGLKSHTVKTTFKVVRNLPC